MRGLNIHIPLKVESEATFLARFEGKVPLEPSLPPLSLRESSENTVDANTPKESNLLNDGMIDEKVQAKSLKFLVQNEVVKQVALLKSEMAEKLKEIRSTKRQWIENVGDYRHLLRDDSFQV